MKTFGYDETSDIFVSDIHQSPLLSFQLHFEHHHHIQTKILGSFNAENMMVATVLTRAVGCLWEDVVT